MKKLLNILSVTFSSSLTIVCCSKKAKEKEKSDQEKVDEAVAKLNAITNNTEIELETAKLNAGELKKEIKKIKGYTDIIDKNAISLEGDLTLEKVGNNILDDADAVVNFDSIVVKGQVKAGTTEKNFTFTVKVKEKTTTKTEEQKVDEVVTKVNSITGDREVDDANLATLKQLITNEITTKLADSVTVKEDVKLAKKGETTDLIDGAVDTNGVDVIISGELTLGSITKPFSFEVKAKLKPVVITEEQKVDEVVTKVNSITGDKEVEDANVATLKQLITNEITTKLAEGVTIKEDVKLIKKGENVDLIDEVITTEAGIDVTVSGELELGNTTKPFSFDIKAKLKPVVIIDKLKSPFRNKKG